ncbi:MAG: two-component regulator propeller domain-containing protein [Chryseolinea sp.]
MSRLLFLFIALSATVANLPAQDFLYSTRNYTVKDGLPQSQVKAMVEDKSGYLWIGTEGGGLARFDGRQFKVYTTLDGLLTNQIIALRFDQRDNLWILHPRGVTKFDGFHFTRFQQPDLKPKPRPLRGMYLLHDTLFTVTTAGLSGKIYNDSLYYWQKDAYPQGQILKIHHGPSGQICIYLSDGSFVIRSERDTYQFKAGVELGKAYMFNYKQNIYIKGEKGIYHVNLGKRTLTPATLDMKGYVLLYDVKDDNLWTTDGLNLYKQAIDGEIHQKDTILKDVDIIQVLHDSEGNMWFASNGTGLYKYFIQDFMRCSSDNLRGVMAITKDGDDATWVGTMSKGIIKIKNGRITTYVDKDAYRNMIHFIRKSPTGEIWVGTAYGLGLYDKEKDTFKWFTREDGLPGYSAMAIEWDEKGMWVATGNGLSFYDGKKFKNYNIDDGLASNSIWTLRYVKKYNTLFVGTETAINSVKDGKISLLDIPEINNTTLNCLQTYQDSLLLIGTGGAGIVLLNPMTNTRKLIGTRDGMPSDFIYFAAVDDKSALWIGTEKGIDLVKLDKNKDIVENLHFDHDNGLIGVETNQNAFYLSPKGKYFGLVDGLYEFTDFNKQQLRSFDIHLTDVSILYGEYSARAYADSLYGFFKLPYQPSLPPDKNHVTFKFNRVDKRYPKSVKYKYKLDNFDKTWSLPSSREEVTYGNLPPGKYTFRVMSTNNRGSWSDTRIAYEFTVKAPFYKTASFLIGVFIFLGGLITLILYLRVKQRINRIMMLERIRQKEQEHLRKEIARDFHDEMGNQLTRIINYVSLLKLNGNGYANGNGNSSNGHDLYTKVEDSAKYLYSGTRDFIWSIDPVNDELSKLFIHIRDFGDKLFEEKQINFRAFNEVREKVRLPYGFSRQANLIFKEAMTNAFKSSEAHNVSFSLKRDDNNGYELGLEDDGVGFFPEQLEKSNGLQNIRERANRINALLRITSVKQEGSKIVLNFTLNKTIKYGLAFQETGHDRGG